MNKEKISRRKLMGLGGLGILGLAGHKALGQGLMCGLTPPQTEGPFYPISDQADKNNDLTIIRGATLEARGRRILIVGQVVDEQCQPVEGALVEIWQACDTGRYNHPNDPNPAELDPNFQYWGQDVTDADGRYSFRTIIPGRYPASATWLRPPHIHYKVHKRGFHELTTQMYFRGDRDNAADHILRALSHEEQERVLVDFVESGTESTLLTGEFNLTIRRVAGA
ncbi:MAG: hypothetical protein H6624_07425 [Bdellovibrionaceae bacterium]|nr:hypothetical protein [Bdellovibrionales bacterium]MCB9084159.1 hypothetical protein [Pseudobdellovibrionaceae bacterium]